MPKDLKIKEKSVKQWSHWEHAASVFKQFNLSSFYDVNPFCAMCITGDHGSTTVECHVYRWWYTNAVVKFGMELAYGDALSNKAGKNPISFQFCHVSLSRRQKVMPSMNNEGSFYFYTGYPHILPAPCEIKAHCQTPGAVWSPTAFISTLATQNSSIL